MKEVSIIGLDLAKNVFQAHGAGADGSVIFSSQAVAHAAADVPGWSAVLPGSDGGLRERASLGPSDCKRLPTKAPWRSRNALRKPNPVSTKPAAGQCPSSARCLEDRLQRRAAAFGPRKLDAERLCGCTATRPKARMTPGSE